MKAVIYFIVLRFPGLKEVELNLKLIVVILGPVYGLCCRINNLLGLYSEDR